MSGSPTYYFLPSFGRGRRNDYAGAIGGYIYGVYRQDASLDEPFWLSPTKLAGNWETDRETIRTALKRLCAETARFSPLLEKTGRNMYRLTSEGVRLIKTDNVQSFVKAYLALGWTPKLAAVKNTNAEHPAAAAKWWGLEIRQWYYLRKRVQTAPVKADTGCTVIGRRGQSKADTDCTQTQYKDCSNLTKMPSLTRAPTHEEKRLSRDKLKNYIMTPGHSPLCSCETCMKHSQGSNGSAQDQALQLTPETELHLAAL